MQNPAGIASAIAATLAAVFAGLNLYLSGRRDRVKWVRESASDTFVEFLTASYDHRAACRGFRTSIEPAGTEGRAALLERMAVAEDQMLKGLSRLRMLTTGDAVDAAIRLHRCNDRYQTLVTGVQSAAADEEKALLDQDFRLERDLLVRTAKRVLSLI